MVSYRNWHSHIGTRNSNRRLSGFVILVQTKQSRGKMEWNASSQLWEMQGRYQLSNWNSNWESKLQHSKEKEAKRKIALLHFVQSLGVSLRNKFLRSVYRSLRSLFSFLHSLDLKVSFVQVFILPFVHYRSLTLIPSNNKWTVTSLLFSVTHCRSFTSFSRL